MDGTTERKVERAVYRVAFELARNQQRRELDLSVTAKVDTTTGLVTIYGVLDTGFGTSLNLQEWTVPEIEDLKRIVLAKAREAS